MTQHIDPTQIPGEHIKPELVEAAARDLGDVAREVRDNGGDIVSEWRKLAPVYETPEAHLVLDLMNPVNEQSTTLGDNLDALGKALREFAEEVRPIKERLATLRTQAQNFVDTDVAAGVQVQEPNPEYYHISNPYHAYDTYDQPSPIPQFITVTKKWHEVQSSVDRNNELIRDVSAQQVELWDAERACANKIRAIYGAAPLGLWGEGDDPEAGWGLGEIPDGAEGLPWGEEVERTKGCGEKAVTVVFKDFLWDGVVVDGIWGTVEGLGMLFAGYNPEDGTFTWGTAGEAWKNLGLIGAGLLINASPVGVADISTRMINGESVLPGPIADFKAQTDEALINAGKGLIAWDMWSENPGRAAGGTTFNLATILIPGGAAVSGIKGGSTAARVLSKAARAVELIDPSAWALRGGLKLGGIALDGIENLTKSLRGSIDSMPEFKIDTPDAMRAPDGAGAIERLKGEGVQPGDITVRIEGENAIFKGGDHTVEVPKDAVEVTSPTGADAPTNVDASPNVEAPANMEGPAKVTGGETGGQSGGSEPLYRSLERDGANNPIYRLDNETVHVPENSFENMGKLPNADETLAVVAKDNGISLHDAHDLIYRMDVESLSPKEAQLALRLRSELDIPTKDDVIQKVLSADDYSQVINGVRDPEVRGFISKAADTNKLVTSGDYYHALGLDYGPNRVNSAFVGADGAMKDVYAMRFKPESDISVDIPADHLVKKANGADASKTGYSTPNGMDPLGPDNPFTGNGFAGKGDKQFVPEYTVNGKIDIPEGAEIWRIGPDGKQTLAAVHHNERWVVYQ